MWKFEDGDSRGMRENLTIFFVVRAIKKVSALIYHWEFYELSFELGKVHFVMNFAFETKSDAVDLVSFFQRPEIIFWMKFLRHPKGKKLPDTYCPKS